MSDLDVLRALIKEEALTPLEETGYDKKHVTLRESGDSQNSNYSVQIKGIPEDTVVIKADDFPPPDKIFKCEEGECKRADFVMIANTDQANWILYIEMTNKTTKSEKEIIRQLKGAQCFIFYCQEIGRTFWRQPGFLGANYQNRFISIKKIGLNKRPTTFRPQHGLNDRPESMLKISGGEILHFQNLVLRNRK